MEGGAPVHRMKHSTQKGRDIRKLVQKNSWFKSRPSAPGDPTHAQGAGAHGGGGGGAGSRPSTNRNHSQEPVTVLFVPRTPEGRLVQILRSVEQSLSAVNKKSVRVIEEAGQKLVELLCKGDPWEKVHCARADCTTCASSWGKMGSCRTKNMVYAKHMHTMQGE